MDSYRAIENLLYRYAELIDNGDFAGVGQLFARGAISSATMEGKVAGAEAVQRMYEAYTRVYEDGTPRTQHITTNVAIEVDEAAGTASARLRFTVFQQLEDFPLQPIISGRYADTFARDQDGSWYFVERRMQPQLFGDLSRHLLVDLSR